MTNKDNRIASEQVKLERQKIQIEHDKLKQQEEIEHDKLEVERYKARWTAYSIAFPLVAVVLTLITGQCNQRKQAEEEFKIKAAEIVMNAEIANPIEAHIKAQMLQDIFRGTLPDNFAQSFNPQQYVDEKWNEKMEKKELLKIVAGSSKDKQEIIQVWERLFPDDKWISSLK